MKEKEQCPEFPHFGAKYPDARCIDGQLYDLDNCDDKGNLYEPGEYHACPFCNTDQYLSDYDEIDRPVILKEIAMLREKYS